LSPGSPFAKARLFESHAGDDSDEYEGLDPESPSAGKKLEDFREGEEEISEVVQDEAWQFIARVDRTGGSAVGLDLDPGPGRRDLLVRGVKEGGLLAAWNAAHPKEQVRMGDRIVEVNGVSGRRRGCNALMQEMQGHQVLLLTVRRDQVAPALRGAPTAAVQGPLQAMAPLMLANMAPQAAAAPQAPLPQQPLGGQVLAHPGMGTPLVPGTPVPPGTPAVLTRR